MNIQYPKKYIVWDLETSGLDGTKDKILEIGLMCVEEGNVSVRKNWILNHDL